MSYNPGSPTTPRQLGGNLYAIDSFRAEGKSYTVNLKAMTCDCLHFQTRCQGTDKQCKHLVACIEFVHSLETPTSQPQPTKLEVAAAKAKALRDEELLRLAKQYQGQAAGCACLLELAARQAAAERDAELKAIWS